MTPPSVANGAVDVAVVGYIDGEGPRANPGEEGAGLDGERGESERRVVVLRPANAQMFGAGAQSLERFARAASRSIDQSTSTLINAFINRPASQPSQPIKSPCASEHRRTVLRLKRVLAATTKSATGAIHGPGAGRDPGKGSILGWVGVSVAVAVAVSVLRFYLAPAVTSIAGAVVLPAEFASFTRPSEPAPPSLFVPPSRHSDAPPPPPVAMSRPATAS